MRIKPDEYTVGPATVRCVFGPFDTNFNDDELEWMTDIRGVIILTGILVRLDKMKYQ